jgi:hypothetical protein
MLMCANCAEKHIFIFLMKHNLTFEMKKTLIFCIAFLERNDLMKVDSRVSYNNNGFLMSSQFA